MQLRNHADGMAIWNSYMRAIRSHSSYVRRTLSPDHSR